MRRARMLVALTVVLAVVPAPVAGDVTGSPEIDAVFTDNTVTPGEETRLQLQLLNRGEVEDEAQGDSQLVRRLTTARSLTVTVEDDDVPIDVETGTQVVGTLPQGVSPPITVPVSVDEDAEPGTYTVDVVVNYTYTSRIEDDGNVVRETVERTIPVTLEVQRAARFEVVDVVSEVRTDATETLTVTVENTGTATARDATVTAGSRSGVLTFAGSPSASRHVGTWQPGEQRTVAYEVTAAPSAEQQRYAVDVTVSYTGPDGVPAASRTMTVGVTPAPAQTFAVSNVSATLAVGEEGTLRGTVTNTGERPVENAVVRYLSQSATVTAVETESPVGDLAPGESADFSIPLEVATSAEAGPKQFSLAVEYRNADGQTRRSDPVAVRVPVGPDAPAFRVDVTGASVSVGGTTQLQVEVTNNGNEPFTDISAKLFAEDPLSTSDDEAFIARLEPGESETIIFSVSAGSGALAKTYPLSMDFQYDDADGDTRISDTYRLPLQVTESDDGGGLPVLPLAVAGVVAVAIGVYAYRRFAGR